MNKYTCEQIADMLVEFADNELPASQREAVTSHLAGCPACRKTLAALQESLGLAQIVWQDAQVQLDASIANVQPGYGRVPGRRPRTRRQTAILVPVAAAAGIVLLLLSQRVWQAGVVNPPGQPTLVDTNGPVLPIRSTEPQPALPPAPSLAQIELEIERAGQAATILAATDTYLADQPGCQDLAKDRYVFLARTYAGTEAGALAQKRLESFPERRTLQ